jgi:hypothetical protein
MYLFLGKFFFIKYQWNISLAISIVLFSIKITNSYLFLINLIVSYIRILTLRLLYNESI